MYGSIEQHVQPGPVAGDRGSMAEQPLSGQHQKYHNLVARLQEVERDTVHHTFNSVLTGVIDGYFTKYAKNGVFDLTTLSDERVKEMSDAVFDAAGDVIAGQYLNLSADAIADLKTAAGGLQFESQVAHSLQMSKMDLYAELRSRGLVAADQTHTLVNRLADGFETTRRADVIGSANLTYRDIAGIDEYIKDVMRQNPEFTAVHTNLTTVREAGNALAMLAQYLAKTHSPDKKETYH